jgi:hypothetical protein
MRHPCAGTRKDGSDLRGLQVVGAQPHPRHRRRPGAGYRPLQLVVPHHPPAHLGQGGVVVRPSGPQDPGRAEQPPDVLVEPKDPRTPRRLVGPDPLDDPHAVVQGVGQHMDLRLPPPDHRPIQPDEPVTIRHRHRQLPHAHVRNGRRNARLTAAAAPHIAPQIRYRAYHSGLGIGRSLPPLPARIPRAEVGSGLWRDPGKTPVFGALGSLAR